MIRQLMATNRNLEKKGKARKQERICYLLPATCYLLIATCYLLIVACTNPYMLRDLQPIIDARNPEPPVTYTVTFDSMGGSDVPSQIVEEGGFVVEPPISPTRSGYEFYGWYKEAECINIWNFALDTVTSDITLYARWVEEDLMVTVVFDDNYPGGSSASNPVQIGDTVTAPAVPTRDGFIFDGWYTEADTINQFNFDTQINTDYTLYAKWVGLSVSGGGSSTVFGTAKPSLTLSALTVGTASYQWQYSANGTSNWEDISGATEAAFTPPANLGLGNHYYRCVVTNSALNGGLLTATAASDSAMVTVIARAGDDDVYIITGSGTEFSAILNSIMIIEDQPIQTLINEIRTHAAGEDCDIQFGDGTVLNIGENSIVFEGAWGEITLFGRIISATTDDGTLSLQDSVSIDVKGDIKNTSSGAAILSASTGAVTISGGTVSATTGRAIFSMLAGKVTIIGGTVTSESTSVSQGTIHFASNAHDTLRLEITGGRVENTSTGNTIYNASTGEIIISGGVVSATTGRAIYNVSSGALTITNGRIEATVPTVGYAIYNNSTGVVSITEPPAVIIGLVHPPPVITITTQPAATTTLTAGNISGSLSTAATVTLGATISYQWYSNTSASNTGGTQISDATGTTFTIPTSLSAGIYYYYCVVSATLGAVPVATEVATVIVQQSEVFTITYNHITDGAPLLDGTIIISRTGAAPYNTTATFQLENPGSYSSREWSVNGGAVTGNGTSFQISAANTAYNAVDTDHYLTLIVVTNAGVPFERTVTFRVVQ